MAAQDVIFSANDLCATRLCAAADCEGLAETGWILCTRHDRRQRQGHHIRLHVTPPPTPLANITIQCITCRAHLPLDAFYTRARGEAGTERSSRHGRKSSCKQCLITQEVNRKRRKRGTS